MHNVCTWECEHLKALPELCISAAPALTVEVTLHSPSHACIVPRKSLMLFGALQLYVRLSD